MCFRDLQLLQAGSCSRFRAETRRRSFTALLGAPLRFNPTKTPNTQRILTNIDFKQLKHAAATLNGINLYDSPEIRAVDINFSE